MQAIWGSIGCRQKPRGRSLRVKFDLGGDGMSLFEAARCRTAQAFMLLGGRTRSVREQVVEDGPGALFSVAQLVRSNRLRKPLLVTGPDAGPWRERLCQALEENDIAFSEWSGASDPPTADDAESLRFCWVGEECDSFIALGGPRTIDLVKAAAARAACASKTVMSMVGYRRVGRRTPTVIAIPTAAGSGAEALAWAAISDTEGNRFRLDDPALVPAMAVLDPALQADVSRPVLAACVMDGVCLAIEAYLSRCADERARLAAAEAVRAFFEAAEPCWNTGGTSLQRGRLLEGSRLAGYAASAAGGGYARALSEAAADVCHADLAAVCAVVLPTVLLKYEAHAVAELAALSDSAGVGADGTKAQRAAALIGRIKGMAFRMGLPDALEPVGQDVLAEIADIAAAVANPRWASPVVWTAADCERVLRAAFDTSIK